MTTKFKRRRQPKWYYEGRQFFQNRTFFTRINNNTGEYESVELDEKEKEKFENFLQKQLDELDRYYAKAFTRIKRKSHTTEE